jgi:hypothetical protein
MDDKLLKKYLEYAKTDEAFAVRRPLAFAASMDVESDWASPQSLYFSLSCSANVRTGCRRFSLRVRNPGQSPFRTIPNGA